MSPGNLLEIIPADLLDTLTLFHPMLHAASDVLRVQPYKSMKGDVSFYKVSEVVIFRTCIKNFFLLTTVRKIIFKNYEDCPHLPSKMYCHLFYSSQCIYCPKECSFFLSFHGKHRDYFNSEITYLVTEATAITITCLVDRCW